MRIGPQRAVCFCLARPVSDGKVGELDTEVFKEFFAAMADNLKAAVHIENLYGDNSHHIAESCFKAFARALRHAVETDPRAAEILPSTKGTL